MFRSIRKRLARWLDRHASLPSPAADHRSASFPPSHARTPRRGFAEADTRVDALFDAFQRDRLPTAPESESLPFPSTGPQGHRHRMREKLIDRGAEALADYELLEMLLFFAQPKGDTKPLAKRLINHFGSLGAVLAAPAHSLAAIPGVGEHSVSAIKLVQAAAIRLAKADVQSSPVLSNWEPLIGYLNAVQGREKVEQFRILFLDTRNRLLADEAQARGTVNHTPVYPREIVKRALELQATAIILVHNHPSGDTTPSRDDTEMTDEIAAALKPVGIAVHDHIIVGNGNWLSFRQQGFM